MESFVPSILLTIPLAGLFMLMVYHEIPIGYIGRSLCRTGKHKYKRGKYRCKRCSKPRTWPVLKCVNGGVSEPIKFPKI